MTNLTAAGLSATEARCYEQLLTKTDWQPADLAQTVGEARTNVYKVLDRLVALGLAEKFDRAKKIHYRAGNPQLLLEMAQAKRQAMLEHETALQEQVGHLTKQYFMVADQPGVRFYQGKERIQAVFEDMLATKQDIYLIRSPYDDRFYDEAFFDSFKKRRASLGINTHIISPDIPSSVHDPIHDRLHNMFRAWVPADAYTAPVEWDIYSDKVAIISYGQEAFATVLESPQIAESLRQLFKLVEVAGNLPKSPST
jgi:sugar-specific transcriptional regulator TrmB